jgi:thiol-disulfide isomerase/thioredoxin
MKKLILILIFFLTLATASYGQTVSKSDSLKVANVRAKVFKSFETSNYHEFKSIATAKIFCGICDWESPAIADSYLMSRKPFFNQFQTEFRNSYTWIRVLKSDEIIYFQEPIANYQYSNITVFFTTWKKDELEAGHEGAQLGLQFKKIDNEFKFAGFEQIP